ncbi:MAG: hypothetical protein GY748_01135 [Planctomycetaceae bacterium]|nr:hypothetical protein [Planctomycetaceae bacterium]
MKGFTALVFAIAIAGILSPTVYSAPGEQIPTSEPAISQSLSKPVIFTLDEATINEFRVQGELEADIDPRDENQRPLGLERVNGFILTKYGNSNPDLLHKKLNRQVSRQKDGIIRFELRESDIQSLTTCRLVYELSEEERGRFTKVQFAYFDDQPNLASNTQPDWIPGNKKPAYMLDGATSQSVPQRQEFMPPNKQPTQSLPSPSNLARIPSPSWPTTPPNRTSDPVFPNPQTQLANHADDIPAENSLGNGNRTSPTNTAVNRAERKFVNNVSSDVTAPGGITENKTGNSSGSSTFFIYVMLLISLGLNVYLVMISRGFYVRYGELAAELRETFTANF